MRITENTIAALIKEVNQLESIRKIPQDMLMVNYGDMITLHIMVYT